MSRTIKGQRMDREFWKSRYNKHLTDSMGGRFGKRKTHKQERLNAKRSLGKED